MFIIRFILGAFKWIFIIGLFIGGILSLLFYRKFVMSDKQIEVMEQQYKTDTAKPGKNTVEYTPKKKRKHKK
jgi:uncharacterized membrane protein YciS (DUF1049 family)